MHWDYIILLAILAVYVPWRSASRIHVLLDGPPLSSSGRIYLYLSTMAFQWIASAVLFWRAMAHHVTFAELGLALPLPGGALLLAVLLSLVLVINQVLGLRRLAALPPEGRGNLALLAQRLLPQTPLESIFAVSLVLTVAICEEFIYRGFVQTVIQAALHSSALGGALLSAAPFAVAHLYQGRKGVITTFIVGLIFAASRLWTGSLIPSAVIHFTVDFSAGVAASRLLRAPVVWPSPPPLP
jgi:uncharacterized protein